MDDLIQRLEQATEGSRDLDMQIRQSVKTVTIPFGGQAWVRLVGDKIFEITDRSPHSTGDIYLPHYTTNLQDALGLVPEGLYGKIGFGPNRANARIWLSVRPAVNASIQRPTPALALCIACLKAIQAHKGTGRVKEHG